MSIYSRAMVLGLTVDLLLRMAAWSESAKEKAHTEVTKQAKPNISMGFLTYKMDTHDERRIVFMKCLWLCAD